MTALTLGKVKLVNRGTWSSTATYTKGDVVQYNGVSYVYKNDTSKSYTALFFGPLSSFPLTGTISSLSAQTNTFTVTWTNALPTTNDNRLVANANLFGHCKFFDSNSKITAVTYVSTSSTTFTVNHYSNNVATQSSVPITIGPRRLAGTYEVCLNDVDWDLLSENITFAGVWSATTNYLPGQFVVRTDSYGRTDNSYLCKSGNYGIDPLFDYIGCWEPYIVGNHALPHQRVGAAPNANPWGWRGHPYVPKPTWSNASTINATAMTAGCWYQIVTVGTTVFTNFGASASTVGVQFQATATGTGTGTVAKAYSGVPWNIPASHQTSYFAGIWNTPSARSYSSGYYASQGWADAAGNVIAKGYDSYSWGTGGQGGGLDAGEAGGLALNDYYTDLAPVYGNKSFINSFGTIKPHITQFQFGYETRGALFSNGILCMQGYNGYGQVGHGNTDANSSWVPLGRDSFSGRSIVKFLLSNQQSRGSESHVMALDEHGELWTWGCNNYSQLGLGPENHVQAGAGMRWNAVASQVDAAAYSPVCLTKEIFFEGNRIVDIYIAWQVSYALDEAGNLWAWGWNNYGQLGFPTVAGNGFRTADRCAAPYKIPVTWATYGGIQKVLVQEGGNNPVALWVLDGQGHVWNCGYNGSGVLGNGNTTSNDNTNTIVRRSSANAWGIGGTTTNIWVQGGETWNAWFLDSSNTIWGVGMGGYYAFSSDTSNRTAPVQMAGPAGNLTDIVTVASTGLIGYATSVALDASGVTYATGHNGHGTGAVGHTSYIGGGNGYSRQQQYGSSSNAGWQRTLASNGINKIIDLWGKGSYFVIGGDPPTGYWSSELNQLTDQGELLWSGQDWYYNMSWSSSTYSPVSPNGFA